ncbi:MULTISPECIES: ribosome maturation factor RimM [unclassified Chelatococcus]|uniref:ribosome maturation factor RimM n=1 Tax=unclassified Chelatococcus TaxID=2638111 RepID=UPI001BCCA939|nr:MULTISPECIES: ribosome maturation factor RimM [unclassified Chelatococcus]CAH1658029.1 Ribosome maturation factor RimM [Hyphomicrobiales bacterium]MBS7740755.1 ribosome maturation factor RimM [Chelatococcus sp. HY11]MBX3546011.1 ribosome maturation factor RimM [Chelatococcus sp.]MCO5079638.1 ribosome maturation factor RimM [Chelatococcus sp.]CAH1684258.1 Ribosome maturation factor RimM [Hyphomicrobiales bacterium]
MARKPSRPAPARPASSRPRREDDKRLPVARGSHAPKGREKPRPGLVQVGEFGRAHGVRGEVRLKSFTGEPGAIKGYSPLETADGSMSFVLNHVRPAAGPAGDMLVARVAGIDNRDAAEALNRVALYIPRERLASDLEEEEFLQADLIGLAVLAEDGARLGTLVGFHDFGAGDIIEVRKADSPITAMVPFSKAAVPVVSVKDGHVVVADKRLFDPVEPVDPDEDGRAARD